MAITLNNGFKMPVVGLGVWRMDGKDVRDLIINSIKLGYRHFDCAVIWVRVPYFFSFTDWDNRETGGYVKMQSSFQYRHSLIVLLVAYMLYSCFYDMADYKNEAEVGEALSEAFKTGLLWNSDHGHVLEACKDSLKKLQLDYLDLYLVHFPVAVKHTGVGQTGSPLDKDGVLDIDTTISLETTWHAMEDLVSKGLVRSIGISNYDIFLTRDCLAYSKVKPAVNQIETHPYFQRDCLVKFCQKHGICVTAHTPLGGAAANAEWFGTVSCLDDPVLKALAEKYKKTVAQIVLRWGIQRNTVVIPKTSKFERLKENFEVFDFELAKEDMDKIKAIDRKYRTNQPAKFWGIDLYA
ncbi:NADP-dependent D-sorbitol-6-phosphate dehydrogenase [Gossypium australe]|uniref:NADP-dependent D-sorbitol-6-phosphate dehydrogenase n=1 Tax=Gossypium australe TaxID=47621 RepID=A0A5B6VGE6_9ROSI|nr:NADP-dependent D-sorbitol-6-phosphate dehydrogenase [Gossypium australe]